MPAFDPYAARAPKCWTISTTSAVAATPLLKASGNVPSYRTAAPSPSYKPLRRGSPPMGFVSRNKPSPSHRGNLRRPVGGPSGRRSLPSCCRPVVQTPRTTFVQAITAGCSELVATSATPKPTILGRGVTNHCHILRGTSTVVFAFGSVRSISKKSVSVILAGQSRFTEIRN